MLILLQEIEQAVIAEATSPVATRQVSAPSIEDLVNHPVTGSEQASKLKASLHATQRAFMKGSSELDNMNILIGAWVYLHDISDANDMRTIFTNKKSGCERDPAQYGLSM